MSINLTEIDNINYYPENIYPNSKEEIMNIEKSQIELQNELMEQIKSTEEKIKLEKKNYEKIFSLKEDEINKKNQELQKMKNNNQRLKLNLERLQVETNKRLDRIEMKEKNELYEKGKEVRQSSMDQLLEVKEREIVNSIQIVEKKKKKKKYLESILEKNVNMVQINDLYSKINTARNELSNLEIEKEGLEKINEEHYECQNKIKNLLQEVEKLKNELRVSQLENRNIEQKERKNAIYNYFTDESIIPKKTRFAKKKALPLIDLKKEKDIEMEKYEINEYIKKIENVEKEKTIITKKQNLRKNQMNEEKENLEQKNAKFDEQIKEEENKNKLLNIQIEEQKLEIKELNEELINYMKRVDDKKKILEEKEQEHLKFIEQVKKQKNIA